MKKTCAVCLMPVRPPPGGFSDAGKDLRCRPFGVCNSEVAWAIRGEDDTYLVNASDPDSRGFFRSATVTKDRRSALRFLSLAAARAVFASQPSGWIVRITRKRPSSPSEGVANNRQGEP